MREIYGDLLEMQPGLIFDYNNEKLMQRKVDKLKDNFNNMMEAEEPGANYFIEFNNEREIQISGLRVEFNNTKVVLSPVTEIETKNRNINKIILVMLI